METSNEFIVDLTETREEILDAFIAMVLESEAENSEEKEIRDAVLHHSLAKDQSDGDMYWVTFDKQKNFFSWTELTSIASYPQKKKRCILTDGKSVFTGFLERVNRNPFTGKIQEYWSINADEEIGEITHWADFPSILRSCHDII